MLDKAIKLENRKVAVFGSNKQELNLDAVVTYDGFNVNKALFPNHRNSRDPAHSKRDSK